MKKKVFFIISCLTVSLIMIFGCIGVSAEEKQTRTVNNLVVFVNFSDETESLPAYIANNIEALYNTGYTNTYYTGKTNPVTTSVKGYFAAASNGSLNVNTYFYKNNGTVAYAKDTQNRDTYRVEYVKSYKEVLGQLVEDEIGGTKLATFKSNKISNIRTLVTNAAAKITDSSLLVDTDGDGYVDCFTIIVSGYNTDDTNYYASGVTNDNGTKVYDIIYPQIYDLSSLGITNIKINNKQIKNVTVLNLSNFYLTTDVSGTQYNDLFTTTIVNTIYSMLGFPRLTNNIIGNFDILTTDEIVSTTSAELRVPTQPTVYSKNRWGKITSTKSWVSDSIKDVTSTSQIRANLACSTSSEGTVAYRIPSSLTGYDKDIYIEYRGENGIYETKYQRYYLAPSSLVEHYTGYYSTSLSARNGLLIYEANNSSGNTAASTQSDSIIWVYRNGNTAKLFNETDGTVYIGLSNGTVLIISSIQQATDKKSVAFNLKVKNDYSAKMYYASNGIIRFNQACRVKEILQYVGYFDTDVPNGAAFYNYTPSFTAVIKDKNGTTLTNNEYVSTGCYLEITERTKTTKNNIVMRGDVNGDNSRNILDVITLRKLIAEGKATDNLIADINNDGKVDKDDITLLVRMILLY